MTISFVDFVRCEWLGLWIYGYLMLWLSLLLCPWAASFDFKGIYIDVKSMIDVKVRYGLSEPNYWCIICVEHYDNRTEGNEIILHLTKNLQYASNPLHVHSFSLYVNLYLPWSHSPNLREIDKLVRTCLFFTNVKQIKLVTLIPYLLSFPWIHIEYTNSVIHNYFYSISPEEKNVSALVHIWLLFLDVKRTYTDT